MISSPLKKLAIEYLRGSVVPFEFAFEKGKKLTVVYGENGTGKTTICDALELLAKGRIGSLENRGLGNKTERYWPSVGKSIADVSVTLEAAGSSCTAKVNKGNVVPIPPEARPKAEILRRSQILRLLEAQPAARYAEISRFIDISGVEAAEDSLKQLVSNLNYNRDTAVAIVLENETAIRQFWETAGKPGKDPIAWADKEVVTDVSLAKHAAVLLSKFRQAHQKLVDYQIRIERTKAAQTSSEDQLKSATFQLEAALASVSAGEAELVAILEAAAPILANHQHLEKCPLCESAENAKTLGESVGKRLTGLKTLQAARAEKKAADQSTKLAKAQLENLLTDIARDKATFDDLTDKIKAHSEIKIPDVPAPSNIDELEAWVKATAHLPDQWIKQEAAWQEQSKFVETLAKALTTYRKNVATQKELDALLPRLRRAHEVIVEERQKFTDSVLKKIAGEVGRLYEAVHPGEGLDKISLELDPAKRASLDVGASFAGQTNAPPQAYFSQSHLDTLGICVFLALASIESPDETILVLDDVLASVDEPHVDRLIEMLYAEADKFRHCLITTHYRPWRQKLRWGWLQNGQCHFVELTKWTLTDGLKHIRSIPDIERLGMLLAENPPDPQLVCSKAGVILEATLQFLVELFECSVPMRKGGLYTIGDLLPALNKKLRQALKVEAFTGNDAAGKATFKTVELAPILEELTRIAQARNVFGAHFNTLSFEMLEEDAIAFGTQVHLLIDAIADPENGWPKKEKQGSYWANASETRRLHPLKQPA